MKACLALILALFATPVVALVQDEAYAKNRPVSKVINLLKEMITQMEQEAEEDEEVYDAMGCWCETNDKAKTKAIADGEQEINRLVTAIEELTGNSARLNVEIANLEKEVAKNNDALDKAIALRKKELAEFNAAEKEMLGTASSLKSAVIVLSKHHSAAASLLQTEMSTAATMEAAQVLTSLKHVLHTNGEMMKEMFTPHQRKKMSAFVQNTHHSLAPASGEIFGMLQAMKESVEQNLANAQKDEAESQKGFEDLKASKEAEIAAGTELGDTKTQELATTDEKNAQSKENVESTRDTLAADKKFLANLKETCGNMDQEYEQRVKTRQGEIQACGKALAFLSSDEAHELFAKTFNFVQVTSKSKAQSQRRAKGLQILTQAAKKFHDPRLSTLAIKARMDAFAAVKKAIQSQIDSLAKEKVDEIKHKDFCIEELNANERDTEMKERDKADLDAKIDDLTLTVDTLTKEIDALKAEVADAQKEMKRTGEDREKENKEFQTVVADQRATQKLLEAALGILKGFYDKAALLQQRAADAAADGQAPPPGFKSYEKNKKSGGVMGMMKGIIDEARGLEAEAIRAEESSQHAYEEFVRDTNDSVTAMTKDITSKSDMKAKAEAEKVEAETEHEGVMSELEYLSSSNADLHKSCDFTLKNFDTRQAAREDEIEALKQSLAMFSGASFAAFLQK